jgi:hypothetical protein
MLVILYRRQCASSGAAVVKSLTDHTNKSTQEKHFYQIILNNGSENDFPVIRPCDNQLKNDPRKCVSFIASQAL